MIAIYPRYSGHSRRYRTPAPKKKMPPESKLIIRSGASAILFIVLFVMSFFVTKKPITSVLYNSYGTDSWKNLVIRVGDEISAISSKLTKSRLHSPNPASKSNKLPESDEDSALTARADESSPLRDEGRLIWVPPVKGAVSSPFGTREHPVTKEDTEHKGVDISASSGDTVVSAAAGTVSKTGKDDYNGNYIVVSHSQDIQTVYAHLSSICVIEGEWVSPEVKIGEVGETGLATGPHLHFEIKHNGKSVNPEDYINFEEG